MKALPLDEIGGPEVLAIGVVQTREPGEHLGKTGHGL